MNDSVDRNIYKDKARTYQCLKEFYGREAVLLRKEHDFLKFLDFLKSREEVVKKPTLLECGRGVELLKRNDWINREKETFDE